jgi:hypothetical protein
MLNPYRVLVENTRRCKDSWLNITLQRASDYTFVHQVRLCNFLTNMLASFQSKCLPFQLQLFHYFQLNTTLFSTRPLSSIIQRYAKSGQQSNHRKTKSVANKVPEK